MRESHTVILERHAPWTAWHETEPYECGWAGEALFFVYSTAPLAVDVALQAQVSADGRRWVDHGPSHGLNAGRSGTAYAVPAPFGGWLRLRLEAPGLPQPSGDDPELDVYLTLKQ